MDQLVLTPAAQFHLALLDDEAKAYAGLAPVAYLADLYPIGDRGAPDYARLILDHAATWLGFNLHAYNGRRTHLEPDAREMITDYMLAVTTFLTARGSSLNTAVGQGGVYGLIHATLNDQYRIKSDQLTMVSLALASIMWLKFAIYDASRDDEYVQLASRIWVATAAPGSNLPGMLIP